MDGEARPWAGKAPAVVGELAAFHFVVVSGDGVPAPLEAVVAMHRALGCPDLPITVGRGAGPVCWVVPAARLPVGLEKVFEAL